MRELPVLKVSEGRIMETDKQRVHETNVSLVNHSRGKPTVRYNDNSIQMMDDAQSYGTDGNRDSD